MEPTPTPNSERAENLAPGAQDSGLSPLPAGGGPVAGWLRRNQARINAGGGTLLLTLAVLVPIITPVEQRSEVLIMTVLFGLTGALMLYTAVDSAHSPMGRSQSRPPATRRRLQESSRRPARDLVAARKTLQAQRSRQNRIRAITGLVFGLLFALAGIFAPFVLSEGQANPDARFLMMIGFSPVAISGSLMVLVFGRTLRSTLPGAASAGDAASAQHASERPDSIVSTLATVGMLSGLLLTGCAIVLPFVVNDATASIVMGGLGIGLSLLGGWVKRREAAHKPNVAKTTLRRAPVPRVPGGVLYRVIVPAAIAVTLVLIVVVIVVIVAATVTPLVR